ncbi:MAG: M23 family metallopeptidase [Cytophagales bacterium]|nr:M23 family metallopeptidase [Cytophagales bacterium]
MARRKTLSDWLNNKYLLIIRSEENFAEKLTAGFTMTRVILIVFFVGGLLLFSSLYLSKTLLAQWFDPTYTNRQNRRKIVELILSIDSLEAESQKKDMYIRQLGMIASGETPSDSMMQELRRSSDGAIAIKETKALLSADQRLRMEFNHAEIKEFGSEELSYDELKDLYYFSPIDGLVSSPFDPSIDHFGVDIVAKENEPVKAVADGTVLIASWTQDSGYILVIQHRNDLMSIYKHNSSLLVEVGRFVHAGDAIAIIGNTGELTDGPHLHFELWSGGRAIDPQEFVTF